MVDLYKMADAKVAVVREHNNEIMRRMEAVASPWKVANNLKSPFGGMKGDEKKALGLEEKT